MSKILNKLERKFGRYAIHNLIIYILAAYGIGYLLSFVSPALYGYLELDPQMVLKGQVWRIFTWVCTVPQGFDLFVIFMFMFQYYIGMALEHNWGAFRYNCYVFSGMIIMTVSSIVVYLITNVSFSPSTYYINMASFLAFAVCYPDLKVYFMFLIPIKVKWLAIMDMVYFVYEFIAIGKYKAAYTALYGALGAQYASKIILSTRVEIVVSLLNFFIFYFATRDVNNIRKISPMEIKRKQEYKKQVQVSKNQPKHRCAVCGRTELDGDDLVFRYCSKCEGDYEYCQDHLYTHIHHE